MIIVKPRIYKAEELELSSTQIDEDALFVVRELKKEGFIAYIVGGCVRDLLLKRSPKDYDISTSAKPEEIKRIFKRRCLLIGRRFRLAHVRFGHKIIEVSTFRSGKNEEENLIVQDNVWGTEEDDVLRRDFTINGLFFDPVEHVVIDYVNGIEDTRKKILRTIGSADLRFKQDPVRMIRLLKFRARLHFSIDEECKRALIQERSELTKSSSARILEEIYRMLESGASAPFFHLMTSSGLLRLIFPKLSLYLESPHGKRLLQFLQTIDRVHEDPSGKKLERTLLTAALIFPLLEDKIRALELKEGKPLSFGNIILVSQELMQSYLTSTFSRFPRRLSSSALYILNMQFRLTPTTEGGLKRVKMTQSQDFVSSLKLLKLRALKDKELFTIYEYWKDQFLKAQTKNGRASRRLP